MNRTRIALALVAVCCLVGGIGLVAYARINEPDAPERCFAEVLLGDQLKLTPAMEAWIENQRAQEGVFVKAFGNYRLVLVARGEKPTAGYGVSVENVTHLLEIFPPVDWTVFVAFVDPTPGEMVAQVITYPYAVLAIKDDGLRIQVLEVSGEGHVQLPVTIVN